MPQQQLHLPLWRPSVKTKHFGGGGEGGGGGAMWHASRVAAEAALALASDLAKCVCIRRRVEAIDATWH